MLNLSVLEYKIKSLLGYFVKNYTLAEKLPPLLLFYNKNICFLKSLF